MIINQRIVRHIYGKYYPPIIVSESLFILVGYLTPLKRDISDTKYSVTLPEEKCQAGRRMCALLDWVIFGSGPGLSPVWYKAITGTNSDTLIGSLGTKLLNSQKYISKCRLQNVDWSRHQCVNSLRPST